LIDQKLIVAAESGGTVITSYTLPWIWQKGIKFWLEADIEVRAGRLAKRDSIPLVNAMKIVEQRDIENRGLYASLYGMALGEDLSVFDHVINTERIGNKEVADEAIAILRNKL
jgi:cytidylate kinase